MIYDRTIKFGDHEVCMTSGETTAVCSCGGIVEYVQTSDFIGTVIKLNHLTEPL